MSQWRTAPKRGACLLALWTAAIALSAGGSQRDSSRVAAMLEAKYGVHVVGCSIEQEPSAASPKHAGPGGLWSCELSSARKDKASGVTDHVWCVTNAAPDDLYESAALAFPPSLKPQGCR